MRLSEYIHYLTREDVKLGSNVKKHEYTHLTIRMKHKRARYEYQKRRRKLELHRKRHQKGS